MKLHTAAVATVLFLSALCAHAEESNARNESCACSVDTSQANFEASYRPQPLYSFPYSNGLYASLTGYLSVGKVKIPNERTFKLNVAGFAEALPVKAVIQDHPAPLVVVLPGIGAKADSDFTKLWPSWLAQAGYHVLWSDSTFLPKFAEITKNGVSGNLWEETKCVKEIIAAFVGLPELSGNLTRIGVVGMSYGGTEALMLGKLSLDGELPFKLDAIQSYSPPINMRTTAELFDRWFNEYRWNYTLIELQTRLAGHKPCHSDRCLPFPEEMMKAGVAASFHVMLVDVVMANDKIFHLNALPQGDERRDYAETWGYMKYAYDMAFPYWKQKLHLTSLEQLIDAANLIELLKHQPSCSQTIVAVDDPLDVPEDMGDLKAFAAEHRGEVILLPRGGHVGYVNNSWTRAKLLSLFNCAAEQAAFTSQPEEFK